VESKSNRRWIYLIGAVAIIIIIFIAVRQTQARREAIRGERPNQVDFSR
jgi:hypothetical protein